MQLSSLLADVGLNIREAHVFSTIDGFSLDVFVVDGWITEVRSTLMLSFYCDLSPNPEVYCILNSLLWEPLQEIQDLQQAIQASIEVISLELLSFHGTALPASFGQNFGHRTFRHHEY
jgi:hypothetical protein